MPERKRTRRGKVNLPFRDNLKKIATERGLSQKELAVLAGDLPLSVINGWFSGSQPHDLNAVLKLSKSLGCDFQWLLTGVRSDSSNGKKFNITEHFDIENEPTMSGMFLIECKRLKKKPE